MKSIQYRYILGGLFYVFLISGLMSCNTMHDPYEDFIKGGEIIYPDSPDSVKVYPGKNRIKLSWPMSSDPIISSARVYWRNGSDSVEVPVERDPEADTTMEVMLTEMEEGSYSFDIYSYDDEGNSSIKATAIGRVYGENYINSLLPRFINDALFANDTLKVGWGSADEELVATEITYVDTSGNTQLVFTTGEDDMTVVADYDFDSYNTFQYRTLYKPDSLAIDTFYTAYETERVLGPRVELSKTGWTATASSYDGRGGRTDRLPGSAIDNDPSTIWVNSIDPQTTYPHSITIDMGSVMEGIYGLSFTLQQRKETPKVIDITVSSDSTSWTPVGRFTLENRSGVQYVDFQASQDIRYFDVLAINPQGNTNNIVIAEIGTYRR